jgi:hypothetical protein
MGCVGQDSKKRKKTAAKNDKVPDKGTLAVLRCDGPPSAATESAEQRPVVQLHMGQAAVGDLRTMQLFSEDFSTCSPIVMFNSATHMGALFHMPAGALQENEIVLNAICSLVNPTEIWVYPGADFGLNHGFTLDRLKEENLRTWHTEYKDFLETIAPGIVHDGLLAGNDGRGTGSLNITANGLRLEASAHAGRHTGLYDVGTSQGGPGGCTVYQRTDWKLEILELGTA